jgi:hypothetical protein
MLKVLMGRNENLITKLFQNMHISWKAEQNKWLKKW